MKPPNRKNGTCSSIRVIDGKFKQEIIPISEKDNYQVMPYVAKEGYILLREYNNKDKYNKIRLEKLNY